MVDIGSVGIVVDFSIFDRRACCPLQLFSDSIQTIFIPGLNRNERWHGVHCAVFEVNEPSLYVVRITSIETSAAGDGLLQSQGRWFTGSWRVQLIQINEVEDLEVDLYCSDRASSNLKHPSHDHEDTLTPEAATEAEATTPPPT